MMKAIAIFAGRLIAAIVSGCQFDKTSSADTMFESLVQAVATKEQ